MPKSRNTTDATPKTGLDYKNLLKNKSEIALQYSIYLLSLFVYLAAFIVVCFFAKINITSLTLPIGFLSYNLILFAYLKIKGQGKYYNSLILMALVSVFSFLIISAAYAKTYDLSYDGMYYHEPAVIALAKGWNPIYDESPLSQITTNQPLATKIIEGSPKVTWFVEASIYKLDGNLDSATCLNLILCFIAFVFSYTTLINLGLSRRSSVLIAILLLIVENVFNDTFSFREDGISYCLLLVAASSISMLVKNSRNNSIYFWCLASSLVLMAGTKLSNLFVLAPLIAIIIYLSVRRQWYKLRGFKVSLALGLLLSFFFLFNPYFTNLYYFKAIDYPYNIKSVAVNAKESGIPGNFGRDDRFELFFYGIFGRSMIGTGNGTLKIPFTFNHNEAIAEAQDVAKNDGGYGLIFSGLIILCLFLLVYLTTKYKSEGRSANKWLFLAVIATVVSSLSTPIPNYARYNLGLEALPILFVIAWLILRRYDFRLLRSTMLMYIFTLLISINAFLGFALVLSRSELNFQVLNDQLSSLKSTGSTYKVYSSKFVSTYTLLQSRGVNIKISPTPVSCLRMAVLDFTNGTTKLCKER